MWDAKRRVAHIMSAWMACGAMDAERNAWPGAAGAFSQWRRWWMLKAEMERSGGAAMRKLGSCWRVQ